MYCTSCSIEVAPIRGSESGYSVGLSCDLDFLLSGDLNASTPILKSTAIDHRQILCNGDYYSSTSGRGLPSLRSRLR